MGHTLYSLPATALMHYVTSNGGILREFQSVHECVLTIKQHAIIELLLPVDQLSMPINHTIYHD